MSQIKFALALVIFLLSCTSLTIAGETKILESADYGEKWPLTVDGGTVSCHEGKSVVFTSGGEKYALNSIAESRGNSKIDSILKSDLTMVKRHKEIAELKGKSIQEIKIFMGHPPKMKFGTLIKEGLNLCKYGF